MQGLIYPRITSSPEHDMGSSWKELKGKQRLE